MVKTVRMNQFEKAILLPLCVNEMMQTLEMSRTKHQLRAAIGRHLAITGDPRPGVGLRSDGAPEIAWCCIEGGKIHLTGKYRWGYFGQLLRLKPRSFPVHSFLITKYPITWAQYRVFLDSSDGYGNDSWWVNLNREIAPAYCQNHYHNHPATNVSWYDAIAYSRWLSARLGYHVRLPTEEEWQQAAGGTARNIYPWGNSWDSSRANTNQSLLNHSTAVGMYPHGVSSQGVFDLVGNVWEWCINKFEKPEDISIVGNFPRSIRGGSWGLNHCWARTNVRNGAYPEIRSKYIGFRLCSTTLSLVHRPN
jgi:formylglycine-generating enzyme required for sulfatase activity